MADTYIHKPFAISKTLKMVTRSESSFLISSWSYPDTTLEDWFIYLMPQHVAPSSFCNPKPNMMLGNRLVKLFFAKIFQRLSSDQFLLSRFTLTVTVTPSICTCRCLISILRIQLKLNTALLSTVRPCVRPSVRHRRDISHFSHI